MDVARPHSVARNKKIKRVIAAVLVLIAAAGVTLRLSRMKPAAPGVDRATVWIDTVKRGEMIRQVRGIGTLVPEEVRWIPAPSDGIIEERRVRAGDVVRPDTVLLIMSNPDVRQRATDAELQLKGAEADLISLRANIENEVINQKAAQSNIEAEYNKAK